jgi:hypothetical protein
MWSFRAAHRPPTPSQGSGGSGSDTRATSRSAQADAAACPGPERAARLWSALAIACQNGTRSFRSSAPYAAVTGSPSRMPIFLVLRRSWSRLSQSGPGRVPVLPAAKCLILLVWSQCTQWSGYSPTSLYPLSRLCSSLIISITASYTYARYQDHWDNCGRILTLQPNFEQLYWDHLVQDWGPLGPRRTSTVGSAR